MNSHMHSRKWWNESGKDGKFTPQSSHRGLSFYDACTVGCAALRGLGPRVDEKLLTSMMRHSDKAFHAISRSSTAQPCGTSKRQRVATHRTVAWEHIVEAMWDECAANTMRASVIEACFTAVPFVEGMSRKEQIMERRALNACAS